MSVSFQAKGHPNISCMHPTSIEFTKAKHLTIRGDCIAGVNCTMGLVEMPVQVLRNLSSATGRAQLRISVGDFEFTVNGRGSDGLSFRNSMEFVIRKSGYVSDRTLMVNADKAAIDMPRGMVSLLQDPMRIINLRLRTFS